MHEESKMAAVVTDTKDAQHSVVEITSPYFSTLCMQLVEHIKASGRQYKFLFAVPKNGAFIANELSRELGIPFTADANILLQKDVLIVDDLIDSGRTLAQYPEHDKAVLFVKNHKANEVTYFVAEADCWVEFFWEKPASITDEIIRMLEYIGENPSREGLKDTPSRMIKSWDKLFGGYKQKAVDVLKTTFEDCGEYDEMVVLRDVDFFSTCEHHFLPFFGKVHIAYIPNGKVVGISKLARLVEVHARRLQVQERLTADIAKDIQSALNPLGVAVLIEAQHFCIKSRGVEKINSIMTTSKLIGAFKETPAAREEFLKIVRK